jgi:glycosyltransferase involved in cell wall biosynthesis
MAIAIHNKFLQNIIFPYFHKDAERTYALASAAVGTSEDFTERAVKYNHRSIPLKTVYVGCDVDVFDKGVKNHSVEINKEPSEFWVTYAGSISNSYDIATLVLAGKELLKSGRSDIKIKILGTGTLKEQCESLAKEYNCNNVEFLGYVAYPKMAAYLSKSDIVINSFVKGAPQSIVNKIGDYLSSGKPMINTLENPVFTQIVESNHVGINIEPGNPSLLAKTIEELIDDSNKREVLGKNARKLAKTRFDRKESYKEIVNLAESLLN